MLARTTIWQYGGTVVERGSCSHPLLSSTFLNKLLESSCFVLIDEEVLEPFWSMLVYPKHGFRFCRRV